MQNIKMLVRRKLGLKVLECKGIFLLAQKGNSRNVSMTTKHQNESANRVYYVNRICLANKYCTPSAKEDDIVIDIGAFEKVCDETLDSLTEYFEELIEAAPHLDTADVSYGSGVLTVSFGSPYGTYVINRQTPNRQIWLSSPLSGPKRYDFVEEQKCWIYKHDGRSLHELLQSEIPVVIRAPTDFSRCAFSRLKK